MIVALVLLLEAPIEDQAAVCVGAEFATGFEETGGVSLGTLISDPLPNNFPLLPMREHDSALVLLARVHRLPSRRRLVAAIADREALAGVALREPPALLRLAPA